MKKYRQYRHREEGYEIEAEMRGPESYYIMGYRQICNAGRLEISTTFLAANDFNKLFELNEENNMQTLDDILQDEIEKTVTEQYYVFRTAKGTGINEPLTDEEEKEKDLEISCAVHRLAGILAKMALR